MANTRDSICDDIRRALSDPIAVCERLGITEGSKRQAGGLIIRCPAHGENNPSCSVTVAEGTLRVKCFACNWGGDVLHLVAAVHGLDCTHDFPAVLQKASEMAQVEFSSRPATKYCHLPKNAASEPADALDAIWEALQPACAETWEYLHGRGLEEAADLCRTPSTQSGGKLGMWAGEGYSLAVALRNAEGEVSGIQVRKLESHDFRILGQSSGGLFGHPEQLITAKAIVIAEGLSDYLAATIVPGCLALGIAGVSATALLYELPVKGKTFLVATDADPAGDAAGKEICEKLSALGAKAVRCRPVGGKDLCDMVAKGISLADLFRSSMATFRIASFETVSDRVYGEAEARANHAKNTLSFGVEFLDQCLGGIFQSDLVLIGASTGMGKTALATIIAQHNARAGKRVHYFALEADDKEIERRMKYHLLAGMVFANAADRRAIAGKMNYLDWYMGRLNEITDPYEDEANRQLEENYRNLYTYYRVDSFSTLDLEREAEQLRSSLIVLDHLHYLDSNDFNEARAHRENVKKIRDISQRLKIPMIVVAHLRKRDVKAKQIIPVIEDFQGVSEISKIATKAIMLAPAHDHRGAQPHVWNTYISPVKCRAEGSRARYAAMVGFNARTNSYEKNFSMGQVSLSGESFRFLKEEEIPAWATPNNEF